MNASLLKMNQKKAAKLSSTNSDLSCVVVSNLKIQNVVYSILFDIVCYS